MAKKEQEKKPDEIQQTPEAECPPQEPVPEARTDPRSEELEKLRLELAGQEEKFLRLAAEYDNYRKRSQREKAVAWAEAQSEAVLAFLPVYDNLERALKQETADEAYAKGVEMIMTPFKAVLNRLGVEEISALGQPFDPALHDAIMHVEDETLERNTVAEVFQAGFKLGEKVIRVSMVKVAN